MLTSSPAKTREHCLWCRNRYSELKEENASPEISLLPEPMLNGCHCNTQ